jgi:hypothetical protein
VLATGSEDEDEVVVTALDLAQIDEARAQLAHFFRDRRIDSYQGLLQRYLASE